MTLKKFTFRDAVTFVSGLSALMVVFFGVSLATTVENVKDIFKAPVLLQEISTNQQEIYNFVKQSESKDEMMWEMFRMMTDDDDTLSWIYTTDDGVPFDIDIRSTAEDHEFAFVFKTHEIYPVFTNPADRRKYIIRQNGDDEEYLTYLYQR